MNAPTKNKHLTEKDATRLLRRLGNVHTQIGGFAVNLSPNQRRHVFKPRPGGEKVTNLVIKVAADRKVPVPGASAEEIRINRERVSLLTPIRAAAAMILQTLDDTILDAESKAWRGTTAYYTALRGIARSDSTLDKELEPATAFFATGRRKPKSPAAK